MTVLVKSPATELVVRRSYDVPAQRIYDAWTDPAQLVSWLATTGTFEGEVRVGGRYRMQMVCEGRRWEHRGRFLRLEPPHLIEMTWVTESTGWGESLLRIEIVDLDTACELTLTHTKLPVEEIEPHREGWTSFLEDLAKYVGAA